MKLIIALLTLIPGIALGQVKTKKLPKPFEDGYILYSDDRGIERGLVQVPEKKGRLVFCKFKKSSTGIIREIRTDQAGVAGFGFANGARYHAVIYTHDSIPGRFFAKVLVSGKLTLYDDNGTQILKMENGATAELTSSNYRDVIQRETTQCVATNKMAQHLVFDPLVLSDFIKGYNECMTNDPATFDPFARKVYIGFSTGMDFSKMEVQATSVFPTIYLADQMLPFFNATVYFPFSKSSAVEAGISIKSRQYVGLGQAGLRFYELTLQYDEVSLPFTFRYSLWRKEKFTIQGCLGVVVPFSLSQSSRVATEVENSGVITTTISYPFSQFTNSVQFNIGLGAAIDLGSRNLLLINGSVVWGPASLHDTSGDVKAKINGFKLSIGFTTR
jgi:hypothetical protein